MPLGELAVTAAAAAVVVVVVVVIVGDLGRGGDRRSACMPDNHLSRVADSFELLRTHESLPDLAC